MPMIFMPMRILKNLPVNLREDRCAAQAMTLLAAAPQPPIISMRLYSVTVTALIWV